MASEELKELKKIKIDCGSDSDELRKNKKKDKKRKALNLDDNNEENKKKKKKKEEQVEDPNALSNFRISVPLREALIAKGINALFPIQAMTFDTVLDASDLVGRARTGQGKTLAFVLPILESLINGPTKDSRKTGYGRAPSVLVLLPTRELALQVFADFDVYGRAVGLTSCCLYGNSPMGQQQVQLKRGVDIVVGTPGRVKGHIERGNIDFRSLKFRVLDEVDEMLKIGFVDDVEFILGKVEDASQVQTLLFSATLPSWVKHISSKAQLIPDVIRCYSSGGRTIIFTESRGYASELAGLLPGARALHGEIHQSQREITLSGFRSGKFLTLVATNVAARGLDIDDFQLIIQCEPPRDVEAYIHRSGRTGRAGNTGVAPADVAKVAGKEAADAVAEISDSVIPAFKAAAEQLLNTSELSPAELLAKALAKAAGYSEIKSRSLLPSMENCVTLLLECGRPIFSPSFAYNVLRGFVPEDKVESIKGIALTGDGKAAVFDVSADDLDTFLAGKNTQGVRLEVVKELPRLQEKDQARGGRFGGGRGGFFDRRSGGRFSGGRGGRGGGGGRGLVITVYMGNLETIPYTKRTHFVLLSKDIEKRLGESQFQQMKGTFKGKILPAIHPESVRVRLIATDIIEALQRGLRKEQVWTDLHYASNAMESHESSGGHETLMALSDSNPEAKWNKEDEILDDSWVQQSRKKGKEKGSEPNTSHIEGLKWEVIVVNDPVVNAFCLPGGKIVVFTGLLEHFRTDAEIATIIGHEVGHAVARHAAEGVTKNLWFAILQLVLYQFVMPDVVNTMSALFLRLPFSRRMEMEADYIGLLLMASAGYNPRIAPSVYEKLGKISGESALRDYLSTHPSGKKRAQLLAQAKVMDEALTIYREVQAGKGVEGFL
ncbi:hypothetical protein K7X08_020143 [Anisodus acutangulus]|uniref:RNA helicase n=1 Tax=Anisodus acutangulus TaxID=402998 RepID=A0A9Q1M5V7_9SOLA|nr:hypothetical protein K7X08_020143 [Anisodus acutangulus]